MEQKENSTEICTTEHQITDVDNEVCLFVRFFILFCCYFYIILFLPFFSKQDVVKIGTTDIGYVTNALKNGIEQLEPALSEREHILDANEGIQRKEQSSVQLSVSQQQPSQQKVSTDNFTAILTEKDTEIMELKREALLYKEKCYQLEQQNGSLTEKIASLLSETENLQNGIGNSKLQNKMKLFKQKTNTELCDEISNANEELYYSPSNV